DGRTASCALLALARTAEGSGTASCRSSRVRSSATTMELTMANDDTPVGLAEQLMRQALLRELARAPRDDSPPATKPQQSTRAFCDKASAGDLSAIKEVYARVDGKSLAGVAGGEERPASRVVQWKEVPT